MASGTDVLERSFEPDLDAPSKARAMVGEVLPDGFDERDICLLLTSEVVTNAVLHAGSSVAVRAMATRSWARVEVDDLSPVQPLMRHYGVNGGTGRGLHLVEDLASSWGVDQREGSKTVWFEIGERPAERDARPHQPPHMAETVAIHLEQAPTHLLPVTIEYGEAVLRELALMALTGRLEDRLPPGWRIPPLDLGPVLRAVSELRADEARPVLTVDLPRGAAAAAVDRLALISLGDDLASQGLLLVPAPLPEVGLCRYWLLTEIASQAGGAAPRPWAQPELRTPLPVRGDLTFARLTHTGDDLVPVVVADDANRIIYVNHRGLDLLGWDDELIGQRLTVIIPPELRERHLAGFARLGITRTPTLLGTPTPVPALRRDGSRIDITLTLAVLATSGGRNLYRGELALQAP